MIEENDVPKENFDKERKMNEEYMKELEVGKKRKWKEQSSSGKI